MSTPGHVAITYIILDIIGVPEPLKYYWMFESAIPDLIGVAEKIYKKDNNAWNWYETVHRKIRLWYGLFPAFLTHVVIDKYLHDKVTGKWTNLAYVVELFTWTALSTYISLTKL